MLHAYTHSGVSVYNDTTSFFQALKTDTNPTFSSYFQIRCFPSEHFSVGVLSRIDLKILEKVYKGGGASNAGNVRVVLQSEATIVDS